MDQSSLRKFSKCIRIVFAALAFIMVNGYQAQDVDTAFILEDGWIEDMKKWVAPGLAFNNEYEVFEEREENIRAVFRPNINTHLSLNFNYRFLALGIQMAPRFLPGNGDEDIRGETRSFDLRARILTRHLNGEINFNRIKGYYVQNSDEFISWSPGDPYLQIPDLVYSGIRLNLLYNFNRKFSYRSLINQTERQLKSAGTFIPSFTFRYYTLDQANAVINTDELLNIEASIGPGYIYTFVIGKMFYASLGAFGKVGYLHTRYSTEVAGHTDISSGNNLLLRAEGRAGLGYNGKRIFGGLYYSLSGAESEYRGEDSTSVNFNRRTRYSIFVGVRLNEPRFLARLMDKVEAMNPLR
jgi:hypothetical protein